MITKDFYAFLESNGGELNICGIKFNIGNNNDIDISIGGHLYKWIRKADERELFLSDLTNAECGESTDFMELFARNYIENETKETKSENERLQNEVNSLTTENETLKTRLEKAKDDWKKQRDEKVQFDFLKEFLKDRDLIAK